MRTPWSRGDKIALLGLIIAIVGVIVAVLAIPWIGGPHSTPKQTLTTFCESLKDGDYQTAYDQTSNNSREYYAQHGGFAGTVTSWKTNGGHGVVIDCSVQGTENDGSLSVNSVLYTFADHTQALLYYGLVKESGAWKIDSYQFS